MDLVKHLQNIGFTQKEAKVYLALLELDTSSVEKISLKSGIKKPTTYVILEELRQKDAVLFLPNSKKKLYSAKPPELLLQAATEKVRNATRILPYLQQIKQKHNNKSKVIYFEGDDAYAKAMRYKQEEVFRNKHLDCYFASAENVNKKMLKPITEWANELAERGVHLRGFAPDHKSLDGFRATDKVLLREVKVLPYSEYSARSSIAISDTFTLFTLFDQNMFVVIDDVEITKIMRQIFELNWRSIK